MSARGWSSGRTFVLEYRGGEAKSDRLATVTSELVRLPVEVIVAPGTLETLAARKATNAIPTVMTGVDDPVERGFVASLARPGGNITGLASARREFIGKLLSLLREILPRASSLAILRDATDPDHRIMVGHRQAAARTLGVSVNSVEVRRHTEVEPAFAARCRHCRCRGGGLGGRPGLPRPAVRGGRARPPGRPGDRPDVSGSGKEVPKYVGSVYYNRGGVHGALIAEGIRLAIQHRGPPVTPDKVRRGHEAIRNFDARGLAPPLDIKPQDHEGSGYLRVYQVRGSEWVPVSGWIRGYRDEVMALVRAANKK